MLFWQMNIKIWVLKQNAAKKQFMKILTLAQALGMNSAPVKWSS